MTNWAGVIVSAGAAAVALVFAVLMTIETVDLARGHDPITNGVRATFRAYPKITTGIIFLLGLLAGHLFWSS